MHTTVPDCQNPIDEMPKIYVDEENREKSRQIARVDSISGGLELIFPNYQCFGLKLVGGKFKFKNGESTFW